MVSRFFPKHLGHSGGQMAAGGLLAVSAVLTSLVSPRGVVFLGFVGLVVVVGAVSLSRRFLGRGYDVSVAACAALSGAFPLFVFDRQENILMVLVGLTIVVLGILGAIRGFRDGVVRALAASSFVVLYLGFLSSYAILVHQADRTRPLALVVIIMVVCYRALSHLGRRFIADRPAWIGHGAGAIGCLMGASVSAGLLGEPLPTMLILGALVGLAAVVGDTAGLMVRESLGWQNKGLLGRLDIALFAFPATFYWFRLFLT